MKALSIPRISFHQFASITLISLLMAAESTYAAETVARSYDIKNVSEVVVGDGGQIQITQGDSESLRVEAAADVIDKVKVDLSGNRLSLGIKRGSGNGGLLNFFFNQSDKVHYILQVKSLKYLGLSGASHANLGNWKDKDMAVSVSGAGEANFASLSVEDLFVDLSGASNSNIQSVSAKKLKFELSGAANANIKGQSQATFLQVGCSGASNFRGKLLTVGQADANASGASNIEVNATEFLKAIASGASNVRYLGQPRLESNSSGASNINSIK